MRKSKFYAVVENFDDRYGGPSTSIPGLLNELSLLGNEVEVVSCRFYKNEYNSNLKEGVKWTIAGSILGSRKVAFCPGLLWYLIKNLKKGDVVYIANLWNFVTIFAFLSAKFKSAKVVLSPRGSLYEWSLKQGRMRKVLAWRLFQKKMLASAQSVHVTCIEEFEAVREKCRVAKCVIVPHGVKMFDFMTVDCDAVNERYGLNKSKRKVLFLSRLDKKKGVEGLIDFWKRAKHLHSDWQLIFAGPEYGGYIERIEKELCGVASYIGEVYGDDKEELFSISEILVLPTQSENYGVVIAEALSSRIPVITTTNAPWDDINRYDCGACVGLDDFYIKLEELLGKGKSELAEMGSNGRLLIEEKHSWKERAKEFESQVLGRYE